MKIQISLIIALLLLMPAAVLSQDTAKSEPEIKTVKIVLHPMPEMRPALKYKLLPEFIDLKPGNAALFYNKLAADSAALLNNNDLINKAVSWAETPIVELRDGKDRQEIQAWTTKIDQIKRASLCEYCDWQLPVREYGIATLLPELQPTRKYARLLAPYARLQIADGRYGDAIETLQAGYMLGCNVAKAPTLINSLVGGAIVNMMSDQVRELIQQPDAPNLYWTLTDLPTPIVDFRQAWEGEYDFLYITIPELRNLETKNMSPEGWSSFIAQSLLKFTQISSSAPLNPGKELALPFGSAALQIISYPRAKAFLSEHGWTAEKVENMPVGQVVLVAAIRQYEEIKDDMFKWIYLPYPEAIVGIRKAEAKMQEIASGRQEILPIASVMLPALSAAKANEAKIERNVAVLRVFEALRLYAAANKGQLPEKLSQITDVPIPNDPLNGTAFIYHRMDNNTAILESPAPSGTSAKSNWLRYEIHLESKGK